MSHHLDFEKPILELEGKIAELRHVSSGEVNIADEINRMETKADKLLRQLYGNLSPAQKVQVARHPARPHFSNYLNALFTDFTPLAGDRHYAEDHALIGGIGRFEGQSCVILGQEKGTDTESRIKHNFGMTRPEGYRKAVRLMEMAHKFNLPLISFVDTSGAYPGVGAEERGQAEAIAKSIEMSLRIKVPIVSVVIGEGGSGGAVAIAVADRILMLEHAVYSVISPEGCASILWRSADKAKEAATALRLTAQDLKTLKLIDTIVEEPLGGAHREPKKTIDAVRTALKDSLAELASVEGDTLLSRRHHKFLEMGQESLK